MKPYEREVYYYETDRMGIVHHSNYARWFEEARIYLLEQLGLPYHEIEARGILIPVLEVSAKFRLPFKYGDTMVVYPKCVRFNGVKFEFEYNVINKATDELSTTGHSIHCFVDENMKPINVKKKYPDIYEALRPKEDE